ncbi:MAG TPA: hypothetical protein PK819_10165, partial [Thermomicrobiales bacterium]|nr:hypothetical protein [Thermomicrobiales bacterium]
MLRIVRLFCAIFIVCGVGGWTDPALAQTSASSPQATPAVTWDALNDALFLVQTAMLDGNASAVTTQIGIARIQAQTLLAMTPPAGAPQPDLTQAVDQIALAAAGGDQVEVALLRGRVEGQVFQLSYLAAMSALNAHDLETTRSWLLVRLFTQSTRLARPSADSTLALESVQAGTLDVSAAAGIVSADLLDTYQSVIQRHLNDLQAGNAQSKLRTAQSIGLVQGLWPLLSDAFAEQVGEPACAELSRTINQLSMASVAGDSSQIGTVDIALGNFRAAPLSAEEQSGRARQLILYMGLVPKEYSRGVRAGQVVSTIEILEASTFLTGARAAFADLRPSLNQVNPETTQQLSGQLMALSALIDGSMAGTAIAEPETVHDAVSAIETTFRELVPGEWLQAGGDADFDVVISLLEQMETAAAAGQFKQAESARLEAYAVFDAGAEKRLLAFAP